MKKFMVIYHASTDFMEQSMETSKEEMQKGMEQWMKWAEKCGDKLVDMGSPLMGGVKLSPGGASTNSEKGVCGFSVLQADNIDEAKALLVDHPHLAWNGDCEIEVHETMPTPGSV